MSNVLVTGASVDSAGGVTLSFQGAATGLPIPLITSNNPIATVAEVTAGGIPQGDPTEIMSTPNSVAATAGNNAVDRVIVDGHLTGGATGFQIDASASTFRGLIIEGFGTGVAVGATDPSGNPVRGVLIQGRLHRGGDPLPGRFALRQPAPRSGQ